jgi:hypothetical protein
MLASRVISSIFGADKSTYPFIWTGDIKTGSVVSANALSEHYLILISPTHNGDSFVNTIDATKLAWDDNLQQLTYNNAVLTKYSYAVLKVVKGDRYSIPALMFESTAPWSVLAISQFFVPSGLDAENAQQVTKLSRGTTDQLRTELDLLKKEHRFSAFDRAAALYSFADRSKTVLQRLCKKKNIPDNQCDLSDLDNFENSILTYFNLPASDLQDVKKDSAEVTKAVMQRLNLQ